MNDPAGDWPERTLLGALTAADRATLCALGAERVYGPGATLLHEGDLETSVLVLLQGYVKVIGNAVDGHAVLLSIRVAGDIVGELSAIDDQPRSATVVAATRVTARLIPQRPFLEFFDQRPEAMRTLHRVVTGKLRMATQHRIDVTGVRVHTRLARVLEHLVESYGVVLTGGVAIDVPLSQTDLASLAGATEPSVHRALTAMRAAKILQTGYRTIIIVNRPALRSMAAGN